jgi:hypothetical protein
METDDLDKNKTKKKMSREILIKIHIKSSLQILGENPTHDSNSSL